jgi:lysozyme family protein
MANYGDCINWVLRLEDRPLSGKTVVLNDGAGYTRFGLTSNNYGSALPDNFFVNSGSPRLDNERAIEVARQVYHDKFWLPIWGNQIPYDEVAATLLSFAVNAGVWTAVGLLQQTLGAALLGSPAIDHTMGPRTLQAIFAAGGSCTYPVLAEHLREAQEGYYRAIYEANPTRNIQFIQGWLNRVRARYPDLP